MDFRDWKDAILGGKVLYRIRFTDDKRGYKYGSRDISCYVEQWRWWFPFRWRVVYGYKRLGYWATEKTVNSTDCERFIERITTMYERE